MISRSPQETNGGANSEHVSKVERPPRSRYSYAMVYTTQAINAIFSQLASLPPKCTEPLTKEIRNHHMLRKRLLRPHSNYTQSAHHPHPPNLSNPPIGFLPSNASNPSGLPFPLRHAFSFSIYWKSVTTFRRQLRTIAISIHLLICAFRLGECHGL